jgi:lipoprotein-anchoring transpeptidase ErfK/SrfK
LLLLPGEQLPVAFVRANGAHRYWVDLDTRAVQQVGTVAYREGFLLTGARVKIGEQVYLETQEGIYIRQSDRLLILPPISNVPGWAQKGRKWIDVSIVRQTLVAYEGTQPVFATLVSTGADGLGDPKETQSTVQGAFIIHTKHVTATMDNDEEGDVYDLRDVPYVQYFTDGYALHGAYWHDGFGTPRSHGCINLSPSDAAWLFAWTDPQVPEGWHGRLQLHGGTLVYTHP